ncbi:MAG TPA: hypothetical protein VJX23_09555 [Candidatus Binataceae bacterium]|nr:hypothetical protein [Candidatus Binataceae bacterium]
MEPKGDVVGSLSLPIGRSIAEQAELPSHDLGPVALAAAVLRFVLAGSQPTFDIDLTALPGNRPHVSAKLSTYSPG